MFATLVLKKIIDAFFFHQPRDEIEITFAILNAVVPFTEAAAGSVTVVDQVGIVASQFREYLLDDLRRRKVLENAAIHALGEQPSPGNNFGAEMCEPAIAVALRKASDDSVKEALIFFLENAGRKLLSD